MTSQARPAQAGHPVRRPMPKSPVEQRMCRFGLVLLALWLMAAVLGPVLLTIPSHGLEALHPHGHPFVDARMFWGIPNFMDVLSNAPLLVAGLLGVAVLQTQRGTQTLPTVQLAMAVFFVGLMLTGLGSAWYHWAPDAQGLVLDRLGMAVTFAGALALAVSERVSVAAASVTLRMSLMVALLSAVMPLSHDNVWPWVVVQFGGMALRRICAEVRQRFVQAAAFAAATCVPGLAWAQASPMGVWIDHTGRGAVEITDCGGNLCTKRACRFDDDCSAGDAIAPILEEISGEMAGKVKIVKLNVDENPSIAAQYGVRSIPTRAILR